MPLLVERPAASPIIPKNVPVAVQDSCLLQGPKSLILQKAIGEVYQCWVKLGCGSDMQDLRANYEYNPMPPKRTIRMAVKLRVRGRGRPLPYEINDDWAE